MSKSVSYTYPVVDLSDELTKREYFAAMAMQGILSSQTEDWYADPSGTAKMAVQLADALIEKLNK